MSKQKAKQYSLSIENFQSIGITVIVAIVLAILNAIIILGKKETENLDKLTILLEILRAILLNWSFSAIGSAIISIFAHNNILEGLINIEHIKRFPLAKSIVGGIKYTSNILIAVINLVLSILLYTNDGFNGIGIGIGILAEVFFCMSIVSMLIVEVQISREKKYCDLCRELKINK